ncbi:hypothetical protein CAK95_03510 [Pseudorhodoplanes sinuspersici]|uniref:Uncharacterized protein n=1 Tax=Pseudorhodoplanes sinuspersici TaxID=1235591 RepID=A0A1W6ZLR9_9HYPH|nr:hypothetical protein CAK95_03510 [Pseudorhodoplanes sinuspersici]
MAEDISKLQFEREQLAKSLRWAMDEIDTLSNKLCGFAYPQGMAMVRRSDQKGNYIAAVMARRAT